MNSKFEHLILWCNGEVSAQSGDECCVNTVHLPSDVTEKVSAWSDDETAKKSSYIVTKKSSGCNGMAPPRVMPILREIKMKCMENLINQSEWLDKSIRLSSTEFFIFENSSNQDSLKQRQRFENDCDFVKKIFDKACIHEYHVEEISSEDYKLKCENEDKNEEKANAKKIWCMLGLKWKI